MQISLVLCSVQGKRGRVTEDLGEGAEGKPAFPPLRLNREGLALFTQPFRVCSVLVLAAGAAGQDLAAEDA